MSTLSVLAQGRARIEQGWAQYALARDKFDWPCTCSSEEAVSFCAVGAIWAVALDSRPYDALFACTPAGYRCVADYNDHPGTTKADILALYDRAIAAEKVK